MPKYDPAVPDLEMVIGYYLDKGNGEPEFEIYRGQAQTWKLALIDILKNPRLKSLYFRSSDIWFRLPLG